MDVECSQLGIMVEEVDWKVEGQLLSSGSTTVQSMMPAFSIVVCMY